MPRGMPHTFRVQEPGRTAAGHHVPGGVRAAVPQPQHPGRGTIASGVRHRPVRHPGCHDRASPSRHEGRGPPHDSPRRLRSGPAEKRTQGGPLSASGPPCGYFPNELVVVRSPADSAAHHAEYRRIRPITTRMIPIVQRIAILARNPIIRSITPSAITDPPRVVSYERPLPGMCTLKPSGLGVLADGDQPSAEAGSRTSHAHARVPGPMGYDIPAWSNYGVAVVVGGAAALTGLLFVAVSVNSAWFSSSTAIRGRAGQALVLFVIPLVTGLLLLVPGQGTTALGIEIVVFGLLMGRVLVALGSDAVKDEPRSMSSRRPLVSARGHHDRADHRGGVTDRQRPRWPVLATGRARWRAAHRTPQRLGVSSRRGGRQRRLITDRGHRRQCDPKGGLAALRWRERPGVERDADRGDLAVLDIAPVRRRRGWGDRSVQVKPRQHVRPVHKPFVHDDVRHDPAPIPCRPLPTRVSAP